MLKPSRAWRLASRLAGQRTGLGRVACCRREQTDAVERARREHVFNFLSFLNSCMNDNFVFSFIKCIVSKMLTMLVTYLQGDDAIPALGDFDWSGPWICDELVYMLQRQSVHENEDRNSV